MRERAFTLIELMLAMTLGLLALAVVVSALVPVLHYASWGSARAELTQAVALTSQRLAGDLAGAPLSGVTLPSAAEPGLLSIHSIGGVTDTGLPVWGPNLVIYQWDAGRRSLLRRSWTPPSGPPDYAVRLGPAELRTIVSTPDPSERSLVQGLLKELSLSPSSATSSLPLQLRLVAEIAVAGRDPITFVHRQDIYLRASGSQ